MLTLISIPLILLLRTLFLERFNSTSVLIHLLVCRLKGPDGDSSAIGQLPRCGYHEATVVPPRGAVLPDASSFQLRDAVVCAPPSLEFPAFSARNSDVLIVRSIFGDSLHYTCDVLSCRRVLSIAHTCVVLILASYNRCASPPRCHRQHRH